MIQRVRDLKHSVEANHKVLVSFMLLYAKEKYSWDIEERALRHLIFCAELVEVRLNPRSLLDYFALEGIEQTFGEFAILCRCSGTNSSHHMIRLFIKNGEFALKPILLGNPFPCF